MAQPNASLKRAEQTAQDIAANQWVERLARLGYAAKGVVYAVVGLLTAQAAFGVGGQMTDSKGALQQIITQPFGKILLAIVAIGLFGYTLWRLVEAASDPDNDGSDAKGVLKRIGIAGSGIAYAGLALYAVSMLIGTGSSQGNQTQDWTARLMSYPAGRWLVGLIGLVVICVGLSQFYTAYTASFRKHLRTEQMSSDAQTWVIRLGRVAYVARGIVFCVIGILVIQAALSYDASKVQGLGGALATLAQQPFGPWLLGGVALGLLAYGISLLVESRYHRFVQRNGLST